MRSFFISFLCLALLLSTWGIYNRYSDKVINEFINQIEYNVLVDIEAGNWEQASNTFELLEKNWHQYKKRACYFFSTEKLNEADYSIAKAKYYIRAMDNSNSTGELSCLKEQLKFLHRNESFSLENLF